MTWTLLNRQHAHDMFTHHVFLDTERGQIALADHSIRSLDDPSSTDDGLLLVTGEPRPPTRYSACWIVPVVNAHGVGSCVPTSRLVANLVSALYALRTC